MPGPKTQAEIILDLERLAEATERNAALLEGSHKEQQALQEALLKIKNLKAEQMELNARRQAMTQRFNAAVLEGKEAAITLRSLVRAKVGHRNELLVHFKMAPLRKRAPRKRAIVAAQPPGEEAVAATAELPDATV